MSVPSKYVLLSGVTGAIGKQIAIGVAHHPVQLILAVRDVHRGSTIAAEITKITGNPHIHVEQVDLSSKKSIESFSSNYINKYRQCHALINNAAITTNSQQMSVDGYDLMFATNVLSYHLLTTLLYPALKAGAPSRIVNVASNYAGGLDLTDPMFTKRRFDANSAYMASKQANRMMTHVAARLYASDGISVNACHPGVVTSALLKGLGMATGFDSADKAADTPVWLAMSAEAHGKTGGFFQNRKEKIDSFAADSKAAEQLWQYLEKL